MSVFRRIGTAIARFNESFSDAAAATAVNAGGTTGTPDAMGVKTALGEIEKDAAAEVEPGVERGADGA